MSQSTHRFVLEMDAQQAKRVAKEFRQAIEAELGGIGGSTGSSPLANVQKSVEQISKTEMFTDATRRAEQLESVVRRIRDLSAQVQSMDIKFEPNTARWNAQVDEFYKKVESAMGKQQADLARGRNVIPSSAAVRQEFAPDTIPVEEWSVKAKRTAEEVRRMDNEYNKLFAELSQAQAERISIERQGIEEEIQSIENYISSTGNADEALLNQLQELSDTKDRMVREEAQEIASYQRAMQEYIANDVRNVPQDGPATSSRLTISKDTVKNMERLAELLQQAEGYQKSIAASTEKQSQSISQELAERRQLLEAEYRGKLNILEAERQTLKASSDITQSELDKENARKIGLNTSKQSLVVEQQNLEVSKKNTKEVELRAEAQRRARAEANRDYAKANTETAKVNAGRDEAIIVQKGLDTLKAEQQALKQSERNALESEKRKTKDKEVESAKRIQAEVRETIELRTLKKKEETEFRESERRKTADLNEEAKRQTSLYRKELKEREQAAQKSHTQISGFLRNTAQDLVYGGLGLYGADQVVQRLYDFGKQGAQQLRTMETFNNLAEQIGTNADEMLASIQGASNGTISEFNAMSYASQVFSLKFAKDVEDMDGDMEVMIRGARRFSQIFTDEFGKALSIEEIFSRLLKYVREGNKELVDQFGITNQGIADALGVPNEGLRDAEGAILRWQGLVKVIEEQLGRLGEATDSEADRFERAEARISDAINRLRQAAAEPIAVTVEAAASGLEFATGTAGIAEDVRSSAYRDAKIFQDLLKETLGTAAANDTPKDIWVPQYEAIEKLRDKVNELRTEFSKEIQFDVVAKEIGINEAREKVEEFTNVTDKIGDVFSRASELAQQGILDTSAYNAVSSEMANILQQLTDGNISYETAISSLDTIWKTTILVGDELGISAMYGWELASALAAGADALAGVIGGGGQLDRLTGALEDPSLAYLNSIGATGTSFQVTQGTVNQGIQFNLAAGRRRTQKMLAERQAVSRQEDAATQYSVSRMSLTEQLAYQQEQRRSAVAAGSPESVIMEFDLSIKKLTDAIQDQVDATQAQVDANAESMRQDMLTPEQRLGEIQQKLQYDNLTDLEVSNLQREAYDLRKEVAKINAESFIDSTRQQLGNFRTYEEQLAYLNEASTQAQGTPAEEGVADIIREVIDKQGQLDERRWESLFDRSSYSVQEQMLLEAISNTNDEYDRKILQERLTDLLETEDRRIQQEEERAAKESQSLAESKRSAELAALGDTEQLKYLKDYLKTLDEGTEEYYDTLKDINSLEKRLAEESAREAQSAWDKAAADMAKSFEQELSKAMNIPGVLSPSQVTEQDMIDSKYGLYRDNADEWLRRAKDELVNGVDRPDVDPGKIAEMLGLPGGLPGEVLYGRLEGAWSNQSLFANPDNLGLLNTDAIMSRYMDIKKGEIGRENLEDYIAQTLQISVGEASMIAGTQSPLIQQLTGGQSGAEMAAQLTSIQDEVMSNLDSSFVDTIASGWQKDIDKNIAKLDPLADAMADRINGRLTEKLGELTGLVDSVVTRVLELLGDEEEA